MNKAKCPICKKLVCVTRDGRFYKHGHSKTGIKPCKGLGATWGAVSQLVYLGAGAIGLPVFASPPYGGLETFTGPTVDESVI